MTTLSSGKIAEVMFGSYVDTWEEQDLMLDLVDAEQVDQAKLQNAGNTIWYPVQQHRPILKGFDLTGQEQGIIEETYPISLFDDPNNDLIDQRIDDLRDTRFWERAGMNAAYQQTTQLNTDLAELIANTGSLFYRSDDASGFDFISEGQALINERQVYKAMGQCFLLNTRDNKKFGEDLAGRGTVKGRPEYTWQTGQIGSGVAEFDVFTGSFLPNLAGGADPATTVTADVSEKPVGGTVDPVTKTVTNVDYRRADISVTSSASYNVGDFVTFGAVRPVGLADKTAVIDQLMTFKIVDIPDGTTVTVFPKPIALDDPSLTALEAAYANIDTQISSGDAMNRVNVDAENKTNLFWTKDSIQMIGGEAPWQLMSEYSGKKVITEQLTSGITLYMIYDSDIVKARFFYRIFVWYGLANRNPMANGTALTF